jgi:hypothetical protein
MFEKLNKKKKLERGKVLFIDAVNRDREWQGEARQDFNFRDGDQWSSEERAILEEELRPILTFNLTKSSIDLIMGMSEDNKVIFRAVPVDPTDGFLAEVLNDVADWLRDTNDFDDEETSALESASICGRGYVGIDFVPDPKRFGEIIMQEVTIPVSEIHYDPASRRPGWDDASYFCWDRWLTREDFLMRFPKVSRSKVDDLIEGGQGNLDISIADAASSPSYFSDEVANDEESDYDTPLDFQFYDKQKNMVRVIHMEYWEMFERRFMFNPESGKFEEIPEGANLKDIKSSFFEEFGEEATIEVLRDKRVKWLQFTGDEILYDDISPLPYPGFSVVPMFAFRDVSQRTMNHFGLVRLMRDPQKEINKRWSQALNLLNQQVQPGVYAETDSFVDDRQAEQSLKEAGSITWVNSGALQGGRIKERTVPNFPNAPMQMEQFSQDIMKKITGINPDLLGQDRGRQEPGVVVRLRQQQGITLLKPLFKSFNNMKKQLFKRQLAIVMAYMPDEQVLRILGQSDRYAVDPQTGLITDQQTGLTADLRDVRSLEYNIGGEEAPGNMSKRMMELSAFMEMQQGGLPVPPELIIEKMDISAGDKAKWLEYINSQNEQSSKQQEEMMQTEIQMKQKELSLDEQKIMNDFIIAMAKLNAASSKDAMKMQQHAMSMSVAEQRDLLNYINGLANVAQSAKQSQMKSGVDVFGHMMNAAMKEDEGERMANEQRQRTQE